MFVTLVPRLSARASVARRDGARRLADRGLSNRALANRHLADRRLLLWVDRHGLPAREIRGVRSRHQSKRGTQDKYNLLHSHTPEGLVQTRQCRAPRHAPQMDGGMRPQYGGRGTSWRLMSCARGCDVCLDVSGMRATGSSAIGAEAEMHLDLRGRWLARNAPRRIAGGGIRVGGEIDWPRLRRNAWQREADGPVACLVHQRGGGN